MSWLKAAIREPLVHFLLLGAGLFVVAAWTPDSSPADESHRIVLGEQEITRLVARWTRARNQAPTGDELEALIEGFVQEEICYREALAQDLARRDPIVRRRLRELLETRAEELAAAAEPTEAELRSFYDEHSDAFRNEARFSFSHVFLDPEQRGPNLQRDARRLLDALSTGGADMDLAQAGDPCALSPEFGSARRGHVERLFGPAFAARLAEIEPGPWTGPVRSKQGVHLVRVNHRRDGQLPAYEAIRDRVRREWFSARREEGREELYKRLRQKYEVVIEMPDTMP